MSETPWRIVQGDTEICNKHGFFVASTKISPHALANIHESKVNAELIVASVNNHAPMLKSLEHCAKLFDVLAVKLDRWAAESRSGGWSTHQVQPNLDAANDCRRYASQIRQALPQPASVVGGRREP